MNFMLQVDDRTPHEIAATKIQALVRGFLERRRYVHLLLEQFEKNEELRREKIMRQVQEGELLVENHRLEQQIEDNVTARKNRARQREFCATVIQHAWRAFQQRRDAGAACGISPAFGGATTDEEMPSGYSTESECRMSTSTTDENLRSTGSAEGCEQDTLYLHHPSLNKIRSEREPDCASVLSDYSELTGPVNEHFTGTGAAIIGRSDLLQGNTLTDSLPAAAEREMRKANYLSLAAEFAALKREDSTVLPFDLHKLGSSDDEEEVGEVEEVIEDDDEDVEESFSLKSIPCRVPNTGREEEEEDEEWKLEPVEPGRSEPKSEPEPETQPELYEINSESELCPNLMEPNWEKLEAKLRAAEQEERERLAYRSDRERVLAELSMGAGADNGRGCATAAAAVPLSRRDAGHSASSTADTSGNGPSMQMCFRNEAACSDDSESEHGSVCGAGGARTHRRMTPTGRAVPRVNELTKPMQLCFINDLPSDEDDTTLIAEAPTPPIANGDGHPVPDLLQHEASSSAQDQERLQCDTDVCEDLLSQQARLQAEARLALAQARPMARMQLEVERQAAALQRQCDPASVAAVIACPEVSELLLSATPSSPMGNCNGNGHLRRPGVRCRRQGTGLGRSALQNMSLAQLQVLYNQLKSRVEALNEELVRLLMERDDAHMEQDSMLVDVEDLTKRAQEIATRLHESHKVSKSKRGVHSMSISAPSSSSTNSKTSSYSSSMMRSAESRVASFTARLRPNKLVSLFTNNSGAANSSKT